MVKRHKKHLDLPLGEAAKASNDTLRISTIPESFYGGKNPEVYTKLSSKTKKKVSEPKPIPVPKPVPKETKKEVPSATKMDVRDQTIGPPPKKSKKRIILLLVLIGLLVVSIVTFLVLRSAGVFDTPEVIEPVEPIIVVPVVEPEPIEPEPELPPVVTSTIQEPGDLIVTSTEDLFTLEFPRMNVTTANDLDNDLLTDAEEEVFGTDPGFLDSDEDGYFDGREVQNLYNPNGFAPVEIIDSGVVREYINADWGYRLYYPTAWDLAAVNNEASEILISSISGDYIAIYARTKPVSESFGDWFDRSAASEDSSEIEKVVNRFAIPMYVRSDGLVGYIEERDIIYTVVYYPNETQQVAFRQIMNMILQSFRPDSSVVIDIPDQIVLPEVVDENTAENITEDELL